MLLWNNSTQTYSITVTPDLPYCPQKTNSGSFVNTQQTILDLHLIWVDLVTPWDQGSFKNCSTMLIKLCYVWYCTVAASKLWSADNGENMFTPSDSLSQLPHDKSSTQIAIKEKGLFLWCAVKNIMYATRSVRACTELTSIMMFPSDSFSMSAVLWELRLCIEKFWNSVRSQRRFEWSK